MSCTLASSDTCSGTRACMFVHFLVVSVRVVVVAVMVAGLVRILYIARITERAVVLKKTLSTSFAMVANAMELSCNAFMCEVATLCFHASPISPLVVPFCGLYLLESYKVILKRNYLGADGQWTTPRIFMRRSCIVRGRSTYSLLCSSFLWFNQFF